MLYIILITVHYDRAPFLLVYFPWYTNFIVYHVIIVPQPIYEVPVKKNLYMKLLVLTVFQEN
jgi:hypothetical protein